MVTTQATDDSFDELERGVELVERLENVRARHGRDSAVPATVEYVDRLRAALVRLANGQSIDKIRQDYGDDTADLVADARNDDDDWNLRLKPALLESE